MPFEFKLPDIGEGTVEGEIVRWLVRPGDRVSVDQPVVEVMTDKATVELTAPKAGTILELRAAEGTVVKVGSVIYTLALENELPVSPPEAAAPARAALPAGRRPLATPATRRLARELKVPLDAVTGTGPGGRVTDEDVRRAAASESAPGAAAGAAGSPQAAAPAATRAPAAAPAAAAEPRAPAKAGAIPLQPVLAEERTERVPLRGVRKLIAEHMARAHANVASYTHVEEADLGELVALREREKERALARGVKLTYLPFLVKAAIHGLRKHPVLNAELDEKAQEIVIKKYYHIGISVQTDAGLVVPVVRHADRRSIYELAVEIARLAEEARTGKARPQDLKGSTFTITSPGNIGGVLATPVVNYPEVAILCASRIRKRPVVRTNARGEDEIAIRPMMYLSVSLDHRIVDGAIAADFMNEVVGALESPVGLLLEG